MNQFNDFVHPYIRTFIMRGDAPGWQLDLFRDGGPTWARPMFTAVADGGCDYALVTQNAGAFIFPRRDTAPRMLVIGDDFGAGSSRGPAAFHAGSVRSFLARCAMVVTVSGAPDPSVYARAASVAARKRRDVMLIETRPAHAGDWIDFVRRKAAAVEVVISASSDAQVD